jgi:hypothetical protein
MPGKGDGIARSSGRGESPPVHRPPSELAAEIAESKAERIKGQGIALSKTSSVSLRVLEVS